MVQMSGSKPAASRDQIIVIRPEHPLQEWLEEVEGTIEQGPGSALYGYFRQPALSAFNEVVNTLRLEGKALISRLPIAPVQALKDLDDIDADAQSMGYSTTPSPSVVREARRIVESMPNYRLLSYSAYSMSEGRVGIEISGGSGHSMIIICEPKGTALCAVTVNRVSRHARYDDSGFLPDAFVKEGLSQLNAGNVAASV